MFCRVRTIPPAGQERVATQFRWLCEDCARQEIKDAWSNCAQADVMEDRDYGQCAECGYSEAFTGIHVIGR